MKICTPKRTLLSLIATTMIGFTSITLSTTAFAAGEDARQRLNTFFTGVSSLKVASINKSLVKKAK